MDDAPRPNSSFSWLDILDRPIAFHPIFVDLTGSIPAALMLSQAFYWAKRTKDTDGWFHKTQAEWEGETRLGRFQQEEARAKLRKTPFWEEERRGIPAKMFFRINLQALENQLAHKNAGNQHTRVLETSILDSGKVAYKSAGFQHSIKGTETTPETTPEINPPLKRPPVGGRQEHSKGFVQFWQGYPVKKKKDEAWRIWKRRKLEPLTEVICASVRDHQGQDDEWKRGFVPHPGTFLNNGGWQDELGNGIKPGYNREAHLAEMTRLIEEGGLWKPLKSTP